MKRTVELIQTFLTNFFSTLWNHRLEVRHKMFLTTEMTDDMTAVNSTHYLSTKFSGILEKRHVLPLICSHYK